LVFIYKWRNAYQFHVNAEYLCIHIFEGATNVMANSISCPVKFCGISGVLELQTAGIQLCKSACVWYTMPFLSSVKEITEGQNLVAYLISYLILEISY